MILVGFFGALRRSEIAHLERETLRFENDAATLFVRRSKTDQLAMGRTIGLSRRSDAICPVRALGEYLEVHPQATGPLFLGSTPDGWVNERTIARVVKRWVEAIGGNPQQYSGHSLRAGFATAAALSGLSMPLIAVQTGHRTVQALSSYVRVSAFPGLPDAAG
jgi:integrase